MPGDCQLACLPPLHHDAQSARASSGYKLSVSEPAWRLELTASTSPSLQYGIHNAILDSYADLNSTFRLNETNSNSTGRQRVLTAIATNSTYSISPSFMAQMADDVKQ